MSRFLSSLFQVVCFTLLACGFCARQALGQMDSHSTSVALVAVMPERVSVMALLAAPEGTGSSKQGILQLTVTTSWMTSVQRDSISVYLDSSSASASDTETEVGSGRRRISGSQVPRSLSDPDSQDNRLFVQRLSAKNRNASRADNVAVPMNATSGLGAGLYDSLVKLRVQVL